MAQQHYETKDKSFFSAYAREIYQSLNNDYQDNYDELRFGPKPKGARAAVILLKNALKKCLKRNGAPVGADVLKDALDFVSPFLARLERLYELLADQQSKDLLVKLVAYRVLGNRKVRLPFNTLDFRRGVERIEPLVLKSDCIDPHFMNWTLNRINLASLGIPISVYSMASGAYIIFLAELYRCSSEHGVIEAAPGDYVIDGGGCWGDTALYFANKVGEKGRVFTFEFVPQHVEIIKKNAELNPHLKSRIELVERAMWNRSGEMISYMENGPGTQLGNGMAKREKARAQTLSVDELVAQNGLPRIDFIKMDIEGAEPSALKGAENTLKQFKPKLAVCVYHAFEDILVIPEYLDALALNYRFYLRHYTIHLEETVLYAQAN